MYRLLLLIISVLGLLSAFFFVSEVTMGVAIIGAARWLAFVARISQAEAQQEALEDG